MLSLSLVIKVKCQLKSVPQQLHKLFSLGVMAIGIAIVCIRCSWLWLIWPVRQ